jgi:hypothetical protein
MAIRQMQPVFIPTFKAYRKFSGDGEGDSRKSAKALEVADQPRTAAFGGAREKAPKFFRRRHPASRNNPKVRNSLSQLERSSSATESNLHYFENIPGDKS